MTTINPKLYFLQKKTSKKFKCLFIMQLDSYIKKCKIEKSLVHIIEYYKYSIILQCDKMV